MTPFSAWFSQLSQRDRVCIQGAQRNLTFSLSGSLSGPGWCGAKSEYCQSAHQHDGNHSKYSQWLHEVAHVYNWCNSRDIIVQVCCLFPVGHDKWRKASVCCAVPCIRTSQTLSLSGYDVGLVAGDPDSTSFEKVQNKVLSLSKALLLAPGKLQTVWPRAVWAAFSHLYMSLEFVVLH